MLPARLRRVEHGQCYLPASAPPRYISSGEETAVRDRVLSRNHGPYRCRGTGAAAVPQQDRPPAVQLTMISLSPRACLELSGREGRVRLKPEVQRCLFARAHQPVLLLQTWVYPQHPPRSVVTIIQHISYTRKHGEGLGDSQHTSRPPWWSTIVEVGHKAAMVRSERAVCCLGAALPSFAACIHA